MKEYITKAGRPAMIGNDGSFDYVPQGKAFMEIKVSMADRVFRRFGLKDNGHTVLTENQTVDLSRGN